MQQQNLKISQMPRADIIDGSEIVPVVKDRVNASVLIDTIIAAARETMVAQVAGKGLSTNDFTNVLKQKLDGLSNYNDAALRQQITQLTSRLDTLVGGNASTAIDTFNEIEAFLAGITDTETLTGLLAELKRTITAETAASLSSKVDKVAGKQLSTNDYSDADKDKLAKLPAGDVFTIKGRFLGKRGDVTATTNAAAGVTPLLPLDRQSPIVLTNVLARGSAVAVYFYDTAGQPVSYPPGIEDLNGDHTINPVNYPAPARYFRACSEKAGSSVSNGPSLESREGATTEAILSAGLSELIARAKANGVGWNSQTGFFELNGLTDLTADDMRKILDYGVVDFSLPFAGSSFRWESQRQYIRTNIPVTPPDVLRNLSAGRGLFYGKTMMEVCRLDREYPPTETWVFSPQSLSAMFNKCTKLHTVLGDIRLDKATDLASGFWSCRALKNINIRDIKNGVSIKDSPLLSVDSVQFMVNYANNDKPITITVHPDVFAKLTSDDADIAAYVPENLLEGGIFGNSDGVTKIDGGIAVAGPQAYCRITRSPRLVDGGLGRLTVSCDVAGLKDGESITLLIGVRNDVARPAWVITSNGRAVFSFNAAQYKNDASANDGFLLYDANSTYTGQGLRLTNFRLSYGEYEDLPYIAPLTSIEDDDQRERAQWLSLMQIAAARQITFATTE